MRVNPQLRLVANRSDWEVIIGATLIAAAHRQQPPFDVDAVVQEQDTFLILSEDKEIRDSKESIAHLMIRAANMPHYEPGKVLIKDRQPLRLLAIVHNFDREPCCRQEWVDQALNEVFALIERRQVESMAIPLLGNRYGKLAPERTLSNADSRTNLEAKISFG